LSENSHFVASTDLEVITLFDQVETRQLVTRISSNGQGDRRIGKVEAGTCLGGKARGSARRKGQIARRSQRRRAEQAKQRVVEADGVVTGIQGLRCSHRAGGDQGRGD